MFLLCCAERWHDAMRTTCFWQNANYTQFIKSNILERCIDCRCQYKLNVNYSPNSNIMDAVYRLYKNRLHTTESLFYRIINLDINIRMYLNVDRIYLKCIVIVSLRRIRTTYEKKRITQIKTIKSHV